MKLHIDIDCFFVSAERIDKPYLKNIPLAVGGRSNLSIFEHKKNKRTLSNIGGAFTSSILSSNDDKSFEEYFMDQNKKIRGIITTSSYEARKYGVKTTMSVAEALRWCPHLKVLPPNYPLYHDLSYKLKQLLSHEIPSIEQFSIDEFFGDVSGWVEEKDLYEFAFNLKQNIYDKLGLPVSIGVSESKWIAKLATDFIKPNGIKYIKKDEIYNFTKDIPIQDFPGIAKGYKNRLKKYNITKLGQIKDKKQLFYSWGKHGISLYHRVCGDDNEPMSIQKQRKSISIARTFEPLFCRKEMKRRVSILCRHISFIALKKNHRPLNFALKIKYQYGEKSKAYIKTNRIFNEILLKQEMLNLFYKIDIHPSHGIIQVYLTLSNFEENNPTTTNLFYYKKDTKQSKLTKSMQTLRDKYGIDIIKSARELER